MGHHGPNHTSEAAAGGLSGFRKAVGSPGFRRLLIGQSVSSLGDWVATLAFISAAYVLSNRNQTAVAIVLVLRLVPPIFAAPVGGVLADRLPRRTIMVTCDLLRAGLIVLVPIFHHLLVLYTIAFVHECISLFFLPARDASIPLLVPEGVLEEANGLILASSYGAIPIAAAMFSVLQLATSHFPAGLPFSGFFGGDLNPLAFLFDAATFLFSAAMIWAITIPQTGDRGQVQLLSDVAEGVRYVVRHPGLRSLAYGLIVSMFGGGVLFAVGIGYIHQTLGANDAAFGWLAALWGVGMGIGLAVVRVLVKRGRAYVFLTAVTLCGAVLVFMALVPILWVAFVAAVVFGTVFSVAIVLALSLAQEVAEDRVRGRVMGGVQMLFRLGLGAGALGIGAVAHAVGTFHVLIILDGNQVGLLVGGLLIFLGALASSGVTHQVHWTDEEPPENPGTRVGLTAPPW